MRGGMERGRNATGGSEFEQGRCFMPGKHVQFDEETFDALDLLAKDRMMTFQELADEAFRDLLRKHGRPASLKEALRRSVNVAAAITRPSRGKKTAKKKAAGETKKTKKKRR